MLMTVLEEEGQGKKGKENQNVAYLPYHDMSYLTGIFLEILFFFHQFITYQEGTGPVYGRAWIGLILTRE